MFILTVKDNVSCFHTKDVSTLKEVIRLLTGDELAAARIANIADNMLFGDVFHNPELYLKCVIGEEKPDVR